MKAFNHINAKTANEAIKLLKNQKGRAKLIAGGTDLIGELKDRVLVTRLDAVLNIPYVIPVKTGTQGVGISAQ